MEEQTNNNGCYLQPMQSIICLQNRSSWWATSSQSLMQSKKLSPGRKPEWDKVLIQGRGSCQKQVDGKCHPRWECLKRVHREKNMAAYSIDFLHKSNYFKFLHHNELTLTLNN